VRKAFVRADSRLSRRFEDCIRREIKDRLNLSRHNKHPPSYPISHTTIRAGGSKEAKDRCHGVQAGLG